MELDAIDCLVPDGIGKLLKFIQKRINLTDHTFEKEAFDKYVHHTSCSKGESFVWYKMKKRPLIAVSRKSSTMPRRPVKTNTVQMMESLH